MLYYTKLEHPALRGLLLGRRPAVRLDEAPRVLVAPLRRPRRTSPLCRPLPLCGRTAAAATAARAGAVILLYLVVLL